MRYSIVGLSLVLIIFLSSVWYYHSDNFRYQLIVEVHSESCPSMHERALINGWVQNSLVAFANERGELQRTLGLVNKYWPYFNPGFSLDVENSVCHSGTSDEIIKHFEVSDVIEKFRFTIGGQRSPALEFEEVVVDAVAERLGLGKIDPLFESYANRLYLLRPLGVGANLEISESIALSLSVAVDETVEKGFVKISVVIGLTILFILISLVYFLGLAIGVNWKKYLCRF